MYEPCFKYHILLNQPVWSFMHEENHDKVDASRHHAYPCQRSPVTDTVPKTKHNQHSNAIE